MLVKIDDSDDEKMTVRNVEDSDEEVNSIKRNKKTSRILSDSDEDEAGNCNVDNLIESNETRNFDEISASSEPLENGIEEKTLSVVTPDETERLPDCGPSSETCETSSLSNGQKKDFKELFSDRDLYDPEDSEDDNHITSVNSEYLERSNNYDADGSSDEQEKPKSIDRKLKPQKPRKSAKNNEKKKEVDEIHSETQRIIRRSRVSLPYHKPRQRTLAEFLQRRPSIPTKSIRMSSDELKILGKQIAKRAKEAEEFYKSSSDEEQKGKTDMKEGNKDEQLSNTESLINLDEKGNATMKNEAESKDGVDKSNKISHSTDENSENKDTSKLEKLDSSDDCKILSTSNIRPGKENIDTESADSKDFKLRSEVSKKYENNKSCTHQLTDPNIMNKTTGIVLEYDSNSEILKGGSNFQKFVKGIPLCDEIDSQDLCLRIEDSETFDTLTEKQHELITREPSFSSTLKRVVNSEISREESWTEKTSISETSEKLGSQQLHLRIEDTESFDIANELQKKEVLNEKISLSECVPNIMTTKDYKQSALQQNKIIEIVSVNEVNFQNSSGIQNSIILDTVEIKNNEVKEGNCISNAVECTSNKDGNELVAGNKSKLLFKDANIPLTTSEESKSEIIDLNFNKTDSCDASKTNEINEKDSEPKCALSSRNNLTNIFLGSEKQLEVHCINSQNVRGSDKNSIQRTDNLKLILEGEETVLALESDQNTFLNGENFKLEKNNPSKSDRTEISSELCMDTCEENSKLWEKKKELSEESYNSLTFTKDSSFNCEEKVLNVLQNINGSNYNEAKNSKLQRTLTLLEERLKSTRKSLKLQNEVPQLKGSPNKVIDLDDTPSSCDINILKQRFLKHSFPKLAAPPKSVEVSVVCAEKGPSGEFEVKKEIVTVESETENLVGSRAKLLKLKEELQKQIVKEREEEWNRRNLEIKEANSSQFSDEKSECGMFDDEEEEILESEDESTEDEASEEEDEDDDDADAEVEKERKCKSKKRTCAFVDDEAEVSDEDECNESGNSDDEDNNLMSEHSDDTVINKESLQEKPKTGVCETQASVTSFKRMKTIDPFESQEVSCNSTCETKSSLTSLKKIEGTADQSQSLDSDADIELESSLGIPPYQPGGAVSQISDPIGEELYMNKVPPTLRTSLQSQKTESEANIFCRFPQSSASYGEFGIQNSLNENDIDDAELLDLCSGKFTSQLPETSQDESMHSDCHFTSTSCINKESESLLSAEVKIRSSAEIAYPQNLPQCEEKNRPKDYESDLVLKKVLQEVNREHFTSATQRRKFVVVSSDEEGEEESENKLPRKRNKKLQFSDDEDENEEKNLNTPSDKDDSYDDEKELKEVEYDSEENEIVVKPSIAKEFFENEAELSESEWGSADEDEKGLDDFEVEEGDDEKLDQSKVKEQLEKIHMRRILDDDQQDLKRLQELYLEDGEFHSEGGGRQRQFRWKNLNDTDDLQFSRNLDDEAPGCGDEEEEDESEWRRMRFEREIVLQQAKDLQENDVELQNAVKLKFKSPIVLPKKPGQVKRGSFLTRSEASLARLAQFTKNSAEVNVSAPTNSRNFVFATLSQDPKEDDKHRVKRKALKMEQPVAKKMRGGASLLDQLG